MCWASRSVWEVLRKPWTKVGQGWEQPYRQLQEQLPREAVVNVDETGWRTNGDKRWIWGLVAQQFVFYVVASSRGAEVWVSLLGAVFRGILCSDGWVFYCTYHSGRMQLCWAHLKRNILGIADYARSPSANTSEDGHVWGVARNGNEHATTNAHVRGWRPSIRRLHMAGFRVVMPRPPESVMCASWCDREHGAV